MTFKRWFVFDAYGTLLDVESVAHVCDPKRALPPAFSAVWRAKQLEYTWTLQAMGAYRDFWTVTSDALDYAIAATGVSGFSRETLRDTYLRLDPFPEVLDVLQALRARGMRLAVLSNGTTRMLTRALDAAGVSPSLEHVISVDEISTYKPDPRVYRHAVERLGAETSQVRFVSANPWDAAGARQASLETSWINRRGQPSEYGLADTGSQHEDLRGLLTALT